MLSKLCQAGMDMSGKRWWQWLFGGLLGLLALTLLTHCNSIQNDIQSRAQSALTQNNLGWVNIDLQDRGRDAFLSGEAPSAAARNQAIDLVQGLYGTRTVDHDITIKAYVSSIFELGRDGDQITLTGTLPDQQTIDQVINQIQPDYGAEQITNNLQVSDSASTPAWLADVTALLPALSSTRNLTLLANDEGVSISGDVENAEIRDQVMAQIQTIFAEQAQAAIEVVKTGPSAEELAAIAAAEEQARLAAEEQARLAAEAEAEAEVARQAAEQAEQEAQREKEEAQITAAAEARRKAAEEQAQQAVADAEAKRQRFQAIQQQAPMAPFQPVIIVRPPAPPAVPQPQVAPTPSQIQQMVTNCSQALNRLISSYAPPFAKDSAEIDQAGQQLLGLVSQQIRMCGPLLHHHKLSIDTFARSVAGETPDANTNQQRVQHVINHLQHNGIPPGLLRSGPANDTPAGNTQLHFTIRQ